METREMVRYGNRDVKCVITEIAGADANGRVDRAGEFKPDFSLADEYEKLGLHTQANLAREEAERKAVLAKNEARAELLKKLGFRLLSKDEILRIGRYYANKLEELRWLPDDEFGGIFKGLWAKRGWGSCACKPWIALEHMGTELIPLRVAEALTTLKPMFDDIYIASASQVDKSMVYQSPVAVGTTGKSVALLARWGDYPPFLDSIEETPRGIWKLDAALGRLFSQKI